MNRIAELIGASVAVKQSIMQDAEVLFKIQQSVDILVEKLGKGQKVLFCGNGGSAADAQHLAAELSGRFYKNRPPLFAEALHVNTSYVTAVSNDYSFDQIYARLVTAMGRNEDILIGLSTSGNSVNVVNAMEMAKRAGMITIGMTGIMTGLMDRYSDILIKVPSKDTPRIQESHLLIGHIICQLTEEALFP
jgi:D-sedoheptulose 7-phosphate isomerase